MIKVILWDIDGTLLDFLQAEKAGIRSCFEKFELGECTDDMLNTYSAINERYWKMLEQGMMTKPEILIGRFIEFFREYQLDTSVAEAFNAEYQVRLGDTICFHEHALETLKSFKGNVRQYAVTNGTKIAQMRKLQKSGMNDIFDDVFISEDIGIEKPNKSFFDGVFSKIGQYDKSEMIIVGDSLTSDIQGGINAEIKTCWFNPNRKENTSGITPDYEIEDIAQIIPIVQ
ncbi:MAG: YjjG family noncanonical pyrimidine nucleotidase [Lachnospira sp.]|nr:YjjG family noncanonical pyrimidine nucleotidase [Lachnospira sp.]